MARALGFELDLATPWLDLPPGALPPPAGEFFARHANRKIWFLHPGARNAARRWPHYPRLVREIFEPQNVPLVILQAPDEPEIPAGHENCLSVRPGTLETFFRLVSRCDYVLGNDTATAHVGAACGKFVLTVFGPGSADWFAPYVPANRRRIFESMVCPYRPCYDRCVQPSYLCLEAVTYEQVAAGVQQVLLAA
jgi:heptosyltransferase-2